MMELRTKYIIVIILTWTWGIQGQNLIPNPGLEEMVGCPGLLGEIDLATGWSSPTVGSTDYFHACAGVGPCATCVPNTVPTGYQFPQSGDGMMGMVMVVKSVTPQYREYARIRLTEPLVAGQIYEFSFYLAFPEFSRFACASPQVDFSSNAYTTDNYNGLFNIQPDIDFDTLVSKSGEWVHLITCFTADGGEEYMTIGNFKDNDQIRQMPLTTGEESNFTYYMMDDFSLVKKEPIANFLPEDTTICQGDSLLVCLPENDVFPWAQYQWSDGDMRAKRYLKEEGWYWVDVISGCGMGRDSFYLETVTFPVTGLADSFYICRSEGIGLKVNSEEGTYLWSTGAMTDSITIFKDGDYWVEVSNDCATIRDSFFVVTLDLDSLDLIPDSSFCIGDSIVFNLPPFISDQPIAYTWYDGQTDPNKVIKSPGTYWVEFASFCGIWRDSFTLTETNGTVAQLPEFIFLCEGGDVIVQPNTANSTVLWSTGSTADSLIITQPGLYWMELTNRCGTTRDSVVATAVEDPKSILPTDTILCRGDTLHLFADSSLNPVWQNSIRADSFLVFDSDTISLFLSNFCGIVIDVMVVNVIDPPQADLGPDQYICTGDSILVGPGGQSASITWQDGRSDSLRWIKTSGVYWVEVDNDCRTERDSIQIFVQDRPVSLLPQDTFLCEGDTWTVQYPSVYQVTWQDGSTQNNYLIKGPGIYEVRIESNCGQLKDTVQVMLDSVPKLTLPDSLSVCKGDSLVLTYSGNDQWIWTDSSMERDLIIQEGGIYGLIVENRCTSVADFVIVTEDEVPFIDVGMDIEICESTTDTLRAITNKTAVTWQDGSQNDFLVIDRGGQYFAQTENGCGLASDTVNVIEIPLPRIDLETIDLNICLGDTIELRVSSPNGNVGWNSDTTSSTLLVKDQGVYTAFSENECAVVELDVEVSTRNCGCPIYIPNAFSPNGDNINDEFEIYTDCPITKLQTHVYDRWGELVFRSEELRPKWDGSFNGEKLPIGVYAYVFQYELGGTQQVQSGSVTILE